mmetsp:Transcript_6865/g.9829  ORF Transcript_6865/g.9829 Transcript_6865/m.9829 type:complete len:593 (-) Transcript_6865:54-1832(-)|eukprot:CAMPEP_0202446144 /NCGR_PEP_ID=MMETSP1360-20130828/4751_1 /ASSEMBLY_ACC=CAM_ASM_000848 /TAXON_ID=515479 /ORGANISM="Licmophora paradoxa, Strain CCMP2313" /LENGTH=592 /DNA_ID=CAMNT_0049062581 /DNA_START=93 /DNA_END=1871 /DNA_ORIENTATION=-
MGNTTSLPPSNAFSESSQGTKSSNSRQSTSIFYEDFDQDVDVDIDVDEAVAVAVDYDDTDDDEETVKCSVFPKLSLSDCKQPTCQEPPFPKSNSWSELLFFDTYTPDELDMINGEMPTPESDLRPKQEGIRRFWVVTTAALPWMTGTAVNPLLRAAYFSKMNRPYALKNQSTVTLVVPWLNHEEDRVQLYGDSWRHATQLDQEQYIRAWLGQTLPLEASLENGGIQIVWYPARWHPLLKSIFAQGDICSLLDQKNGNKLDVCFLEEPEHLNWYRAPGKVLWTSLFTHVVGIGHTNYEAYLPPPMSSLVYGYSGWMVRAYCHKWIKLSPVLQRYAPEKETVQNVHGIRNDFFLAAPPQNGIYYIGKLLWAKGFGLLLRLQRSYKRKTGRYFQMDVIGNGSDEAEIQKHFKNRAMNFVGRQDHYEFCQKYKIFVNPSISEVLCTTTAEALAMGKFVICPAHPSNTFFRAFPNCLQYKNHKEFLSLLEYALKHTPAPLSEDLRHELTWEAATERCLEASIITRREAARLERVGKTKADQNLAKLHNELAEGRTGNVLRSIMFAGPVARHTPPTTRLNQSNTATPEQSRTPAVGVF